MGLKRLTVSRVGSMYIEHMLPYLGGNAKLKHVLKCFSGPWPEQSAIYMYNDQVLKECSVRASFYNLGKEKRNSKQISQYFKTC